MKKEKFKTPRDLLDYLLKSGLIKSWQKSYVNDDEYIIKIN